LAVKTSTLDAGGPATPARPLAVSARRTGRRIALDGWAARLVVVGGLLIIAAILAILVVIAAQAYPLFRPATSQPVARFELGAPAAGRLLSGPSVGLDEYREAAHLVDPRGMVALLSLRDGRAQPPAPVPALDGAALTAVAEAAGRYLLGTSDGRVVPFQIKTEVSFGGGARAVTSRPEFGEPSVVDEARRPLGTLAFAPAESGPIVAAQVGPAEVMIQTVVEKKALVGPSRREASTQALALELSGEITGLAMDTRGDDLLVATSRGQLVRVDLRDRAHPSQAEAVQVGATPDPVTALQLLLGARTLVVGDRGGRVSSWQVVPPAGGNDRRLARIHDFERHPAPVTGLAPSHRDKGFVSVDAAGGLKVHYATSGATLLTRQADLPAGAALRAVAFAPRADGFLTVDDRGGLTHWSLDNHHPEVTWRTLFGPVWYEGYPGPDYVWQSTGGTDDFEPKFSLTPLVFGTLKGTVYALLVAVPLALLSALYVSEFMHPGLKAYIKPVVEIMAALPSVVLGFLAGLWLAPMIERVAPGLFLVPVVVPAAVLLTLFAWRTLPARIRQSVRGGGEVFLLVPVVILGLAAAFQLGGLVESRLLGGSYRSWLLSALGLTYDQRNSLVVGIAMGFAVIPIIFTIAEDSLANVPGLLRAGSLALGATRWQTALRIVIPTASPGIFSAVMIGFGRAVGETMIVLMATGNTPVMDWSIFNGFRALSANVAVELPEAPEGGTLFRVLFLAAFLLFCLTFAVNSVAEVVRLRLRRRFRYL
jgi:phosphate transport system permease protein